MLTVISGVTSKQVLADEIIEILNSMDLDGYFYLGYPVLGGIDGKIKVDALLVCKQYGLVIFDLEMSAEENIDAKIELLDELYNNMEARLKRYGYLSKHEIWFSIAFSFDPLDEGFWRFCLPPRLFNCEIIWIASNNFV